MTAPRIYTTAKHRLQPEYIDADAVRVVQRLREQGHQAFIVGGAIRDLLIGRTPKDFDVATSATPEQVHKAFRNSRLIGRRFRIAHVFFRDRKIIEVATFQREGVIEGEPWGSPEDDARRRDLTINAFFLDPTTLEVFDYVDGWGDLQDRLIRVIGDPDQRFAEDPVRMIRCIRHSARTGFLIEDATWQAILRNAERIVDCNASRLSQEFAREFQEGAAQRSLKLLHKSGLLRLILPDFDEFLSGLESRPESKRTYGRLLALLDKEGATQSLPATLMMACAMGPAVAPELLSVLPANAEFELDALMRRLAPFVAAVSLQRGYLEPLAQALCAQPKLDQSRRSGVIARKLRGKSYFGLAMHLFLLRHRAIGSWIPESWTDDAPPVDQASPPVDRRELRRADRERDRGDRPREPRPRAESTEASPAAGSDAATGDREGSRRKRRRRGGRGRGPAGAEVAPTSANAPSTPTGDKPAAGDHGPKPDRARGPKPDSAPPAPREAASGSGEGSSPAKRRRRRRRGGRGRGPAGAAGGDEG